MKWAIFAAQIWLVCGSIFLVSVIHTPSLATMFRRRVREQLEASDRTQRQLSRSLELDAGQVSRFLKFDKTAAQVTIARLESIAAFFGHIPPADLLREPEAEPLALSPVEADLIGLVRLLPQEQKENLVEMLDYFFKPRREAQAEKRALAMLRTSMERQLAEPPRRGR